MNLTSQNWSSATCVALLLILCSSPALMAAAVDEFPIPDISYSKFVLDNGLTVVIHEDHKAPIVAVNVWYHVGSKDEPEGKSGFAHLFEHLMFNGSEHFDDEYFKPFEKVGATEMNGTTDTDRTNYFQNVPSTALELALWMESDRMCCMQPVVSQARLDEQRGVVQNEKRQRENQPYGRTLDLIQENTYPEGHPYDHTVIGSMADLNAASLEDVRSWLDAHYTPNNATLVIAGDIETSHALDRVKHYFGGIEPGPPLEYQLAWPAPRTGMRRAPGMDVHPSRMAERLVQMNPSEPATKDTPRIATFEESIRSVCSGNARFVMKMDIVKPMPPSRPVLAM